MPSRIPIDREEIADFCRKHHIVKLSVFGSVVREDFRPDSDVDVLVEFEPGHVLGFIRLHFIEEELSLLFCMDIQRMLLLLQNLQVQKIYVSDGMDRVISK